MNSLYPTSSRVRVFLCEWEVRFTKGSIDHLLLTFRKFAEGPKLCKFAEKYRRNSDYKSRADRWPFATSNEFSRGSVGKAAQTEPKRRCFPLDITMRSGVPCSA